MIVLNTVLVFCVIAGNELVSAQDAPASPALSSASNPSAPVAPAAPAAPAVPEAPAAAQAPSSKTASDVPSETQPAKPLVASRSESSDKKDAAEPENTMEKDLAPKSSSSSEPYDKEKLLSTLNSLASHYDKKSSPGVGPEAVPLKEGKNFDFFLVKIPKPKIQSQSRSLLDDDDDDNADNDVLSRLPSNKPMALPYQYPNPAPQTIGSTCPCAHPPAQVAPNFDVMRNIYGNDLNLNSVLSPSCPPGMLPVAEYSPATVITGNALVYSQPPRAVPIMRKPAIDNIPVQDGIHREFNDLGPEFYPGGYQMMNSMTPNLFVPNEGLPLDLYGGNLVAIPESVPMESYDLSTSFNALNSPFGYPPYQVPNKFYPPPNRIDQNDYKISGKSLLDI